MLQLLLATIGISTLAEAELIYGGEMEKLIFFFVRQFFTTLIIPIAILFIQSYGQTKKKTFSLAWTSIPVSLILALIVLLLIYGNGPFLICISNHTNISSLGHEQNLVEYLIHLCSFWLFYGILTVELIIFGILIISRITRIKVTMLYKGVLLILFAYSFIESIQLSPISNKIWIRQSMYIILSASLYYLAFISLYQDNPDLSLRDIIKLSAIMTPDNQENLTGPTNKQQNEMKYAVIQVPQHNLTDDNYLRKKFENLIITERLYLKPGIRISDVASMLQTNRTYISKLVNDTYNMSFSDYINILRIKYAQEYLIQHKEARQSDIAATCGFPDASAFNNVFKKLTGMTPKIWLAAYS